MPSTLTRQQLRTVQLVPLTAFDDRGDLAIEPMQAHTQRLFDAGIRTFIPCAGSAEFDSLADEEIASVIAMTRQVVDGGAAVIAPIGHRFRQALDMGRRFADAGADAVLVMPLAFPYLSNAGARDYYLQLLDNLPCPVLIYKKAAIPSDALLLELADHPNLIGVKHAVNDMDAFHRLIVADGDRIDWYCGSAERFAPFYALAGSPGYTSGAGNICPHLTLAMHAALAAGRWEEAMRLQRLINPIEHFRAREENSFNISFLKYAVTRTGLDFGQPRPPQRRLTGAETAEIDAMLPPILEAEQAQAAEATAGVR